MLRCLFYLTNCGGFYPGFPVTYSARFFFRNWKGLEEIVHPNELSPADWL